MNEEILNIGNVGTDAEEVSGTAETVSDAVSDAAGKATEAAADTVGAGEKADEATGKRKNKKHRRRQLHDINAENDMRYRGPLSYRGLKIIGWLSIIFSQLVFVLNIGRQVSGSTEPLFLGDVGNALLSSLGLPLLLISNFAILLNGRSRYKQLLIINGSIASGLTILYLILYKRYALGLVAINAGNEGAAAVAIDNALLQKPDYTGYFTFNIYLDIFLCTLFMFFMDYKPKKFFQGKKLFLFRAFAILPVLYEVFCIVLKVLATDKYMIIPMVFYPFLTTKPPLSFLLFIIIVIYIKGREKRFIKHGKTHEQYEAFLKTNTNSFHFSRFLAILTVILTIIDFIQIIVLTVIYCNRIGVDFLSLNDPGMEGVIMSATKWAMSFGAGQMASMILIAPIMLLFSYTRTHESRLPDYAIPLVSIVLIVLCYIEGLYQVAGTVIRNTSSMILS